MKLLTFYFDVVSPYAYLAFERLPQALAGLSYSVDYQPVLFAGMLAHWGQKGPAEIEPKRAWTYRQVQWLAHRHGTPLQLPAQHPFNPLGLLRLALACAPDGGTPNRYVCEQLLHHVWRGGEDANDPARLVALTERLAPAREPQGGAVKQALKDATSAAVARGVFGVPTVAIENRLFWGLDALEMLADCLRGDSWFDGAAWTAAGAMRPGVRRPSAGVHGDSGANQKDK